VVCGTKDQLSKVDEPSRCEYTAELTTPVACVADRVPELKAQIEAKKKMLEAVHDEL
jgi:protein kinase C substrate 80K-H